METLRNVSLVGLLTIVLTFVPLVMAIAYVVRPNERRLALMRPLSLAGLFAGLTGATLGLINTFVYLSGNDIFHRRDLRHHGDRGCRVAGSAVSSASRT